MLLKLTCPSCGRVEQASERVLGKEVRCPCGTQFRVLQPKPAAPAAASRCTPRRPQAAARTAIAACVSQRRSIRAIERRRRLARGASARSPTGRFRWSTSSRRTAGPRSPQQQAELGHAALGLRGHRGGGVMSLLS